MLQTEIILIAPKIPAVVIAVYLFVQGKIKELSCEEGGGIKREKKERSEDPLIIVSQCFSNGSLQSLASERLITF